MASHVVDMLRMYELVIELQLSQCYPEGEGGSGIGYRIPKFGNIKYLIFKVPSIYYLFYKISDFVPNS